jgi:hypothetical protein
MTVRLRASFRDLSNQVIARGANFILTFMAFALVSISFGAGFRADFGYWWSIGLMAGGVSLGGVASALVRAAAIGNLTQQRMRQLLRLSVAGLVAGLCIVALVAVLGGSTGKSVGVVLIVCLFGYAVQLQASMLALVRIHGTVSENIRSAFAAVSVTGLGGAMLLGVASDVRAAFAVLLVAYVLGACAIALVSGDALGSLYRQASTASRSGKSFIGSVAAFTSITAFSYVTVNIDFTIFRLFQSTLSFGQLSEAKVFFERFIVPILGIYASAVSMNVFRAQPDGPHRGSLVLANPLRYVGMSIGVVVAISVAYIGYERVLSPDGQGISVSWVAIASFGYLVFSLNGIMFDLLATRRHVVAVIAQVVSFLLFAATVQGFAITNYGIKGWAVGWLLVNLCIALVLGRQFVAAGAIR